MWCTFRTKKQLFIDMWRSDHAQHCVYRLPSRIDLTRLFTFDERAYRRHSTHYAIAIQQMWMKRSAKTNTTKRKDGEKHKKLFFIVRMLVCVCAARLFSLFIFLSVLSIEAILLMLLRFMFCELVFMCSVCLILQKLCVL